jgi:electron transport complex protein RnfG
MRGGSVQKFISESWLVLIMAVIFAFLLAGAEKVLGPKIQANKENEILRAVYEVVPDADPQTPPEKHENVAMQYDVFKCRDAHGELAGWAIKGQGFGFADVIVLVVGLSPDAETVTGLKVVDQKETPGLGNIITEPDWDNQYNNLSALEVISVKKQKADKAANEIQAITGATISSVAVTDIVNQALEDVRPKLAELK